MLGELSKVRFARTIVLSLMRITRRAPRRWG
jgi:hypothetical protein